MSVLLSATIGLASACGPLSIPSGNTFCATQTCSHIYNGRACSYWNPALFILLLHHYCLFLAVYCWFFLVWVQFLLLLRSGRPMSVVLSLLVFLAPVFA